MGDNEGGMERWIERYSTKFDRNLGEYYDHSSYAYLKNPPDGVLPIGHWRKSNFHHPYIFGKAPPGTTFTADIMEYSNGSFYSHD